LFRKVPFITCFCLCGALLYSLYGNAQKDSAVKIRHVLVLPIIARSIETGWAFGAAGSSTFRLRAHDTASRTSNVQALAIYTTRNQLVVAINGSIYFPGEKYILNQQVTFSSFPDKFWGLGRIAPDSNKENYKFKQFYIYLHPQRLIGNNLFLGLLYEFQRVMQVEYMPGGLFDKENILGRNGYFNSGLGPSITYDTRNNAFSPDHGSMLQFYFNHFDRLLGSEYQYTNFVLDLRRFFSINPQQVLALQAYGYFNEGQVPLRSLAALGGASRMRGYYEGRYRDRNLVVFQGEYRMRLYKRLGAVVFGDFGNTAKDLTDLSPQSLKYSYGGGLRVALIKKEKLNLRLDYGLNRESKGGFYLQLGEAF
jgi:outer membrane protein assembly factor BamA